MASDGVLRTVAAEAADSIVNHGGITRHEEDHRRFRNVLGTIRAIARRSADDADDVETYADRLDGRLASYIRVQGIIMREGAIDLETLLADELLPFGLRYGREVALTGPSVRIGERAAGLLGLLIHELAASVAASALYGGGRSEGVVVEWRRVGIDQALEIDWRNDRWLPAGRPWATWLHDAFEQQTSGSIERRAAELETTFTIILPSNRLVEAETAG